MASIPKRLPSIQSHDTTSAESVRYGTNGAVYVVDGQAMQGRGAHASVMKVQNIGTGEYFGAKAPHFKVSDDADTARQRFEALQMEYTHIKHLDHPHILKAFDLVMAEDLTLPPWMIVEYIPLNLREALPSLDERDRLAAMTHIASALTYLHANGITHRDIKPDNVLISRQDGLLVAKVADFGTSKQNNSAKMDTFTGTQIYMAPEVFVQPRYYSSKVDMWAVGMIGMQLFTSWDPENDDQWDPRDRATWVCTVALQTIPEAPKFLRPMIKGLLRKHAGRRWSSWKCLSWLWKHESLNSPPFSESGAGRANAHERPVGRDLLRFNISGDYYSRHRRSPNPSLSTARVRVSENPDGLPDTASPCAGAPDILSAASTPRADEVMSDMEKSDEESSGCDTDLEDWRLALTEPQ
ncbi:Calcium/calmodulin-dependent protein kinase type IV [Cordyceps militaris CM01]|uniref:non-specific serine/threonine protein kinase n=1 Tax=Cordyceps militaris (strain CM01) TaxID=983644 RepID=G3JU59_CORMM|nr:Calcium/calmodulin-dependent protein kinase type IV [Cordyceps militaris CM01]EGX87887.1 Calcium/calmodulin-dependent protein kinase type IV [Cordyceps militaris CM01]